LIPQLDTVIIEVSSGKGLSLRGIQGQTWTYGDTGLYIGYFNMKVIVIVFAKDENIQNHC